MTDNLETIPLTIDPSEFEEGCIKLLNIIRPEWTEDRIHTKYFKDGVTNKMAAFFLSDTGVFDENNPDIVIIRVFGEGTDLFIDRKREREVLQLVRRSGNGPKVYGFFENGMAIELIPGIVLTDPEVYAEHHLHVIHEAAVLHRSKFEDIPDPQSVFYDRCYRYMTTLPENFSDEQKNERYKNNFLPYEELLSEFYELKELLLSLDSPVVFAHNDLSMANFLYNANKDSVTLIDYEYGDFNNQAFDLANHFCEFAGVTNIDFSLYPSKEYQFEWLRRYLEIYKNDGAEITEEEINKLYVQVQGWSLASHFFWAIWGLLMAEHSLLDFDYMEYAEIRYNEYWKKKDDVVALINEQE